MQGQVRPVECIQAVAAYAVQQPEQSYGQTCTSSAMHVWEACLALRSLGTGSCMCVVRCSNRCSSGCEWAPLLLVVMLILLGLVLLLLTGECPEHQGHLA